MNPENRFSRPSLVILAGGAGFLAGALLLWRGSAFMGALPLPFGDALVRLPILMGGDFTFLLAWFAFWALVGFLLGIRLTRRRAPALSPALRAERTKRHGEKSFTLIELLIVIAIIAVLAVVVVLVLNPGQLLMQARDSNRLSDMKTLNQAITLYSEDVGGSLGTSSTTYVSIPDPAATSTLGDQCQGLGLPALPTGDVYHCAATSTYKNTDGTGWIPVNFRAESFGSSLGTLPVDPVNQTSSGLYYTYVAQGDPWELTAVMESQKYGLGGSNDTVSTDGGILPDTYEVGTDLALDTVDRGPNVVGEWLFDEGSGTMTFDSSGNGNTGTLEGTTLPTWVTGGCVEGDCLSFDNSTGYVSINGAIGGLSSLTVMAWVSLSSTTNPYQTIFRLVDSNTLGFELGSAGTQIRPRIDTSALTNQAVFGPSSVNIEDGSWHFVALVFDGSTQQATAYADGVVGNTILVTGAPPTTLTNNTIDQGWAPGWNGLIDDVRIYNRALSASEIQAIYNAEK